ncbi:MAG: aldo/keto reductase [Chloroflexi bacterium]|nr:aldo/keto reductase [Chloroflexota bacterium]
MDYGFSARKAQDTVDEILETAKGIGITFVDTARGYGDSEAKIGDHLRRRGYPGLVLATKLAPDIPVSVADGAELKASILASIDASRRALGRDVLDIVLLHRSEDWILRSDMLWTTVSEIGSTGVWKSFGISVYDVPAARAALDAGAGIVEVVEAPYNVFDRRFAALARQFERQGVHVVSRSAFLKGLIPLPTDALPPWAAELAPAKRRLEDLAAEGGTSVAELALRACLRAPFIGSTIVGVDSATELAANARSLAPRPDLDRVLDEVERIDVDPASIDPRRWLAHGF